MSATALNGFVERLRRGLPTTTRTDGELVREYAATGSESAFAELTRRFAPLVWGVCRRTVPDREHAEDAFQATFIVLTRKAGSIRPPAAVGGWLHTVAVHTSRRARAMSDRRRCRLQPMDAHDPPARMPAEPTDPDSLRALDEEIARLPESLRAAIVLCEIDGVSRKEAASRLGIAEGTLSSRLASARKTLAARLRTRGITLAAALALVPATADATAPTVAATASHTVSTLADGAIRTMFLSKLKLTAASTLAVLAVLAATTGSLATAPPESPREQYQIKAPVPKAEPKEGRILFWLDEKPLLLKVDGTELESPDRIPKVTVMVGWGNAQMSPDGKRVAFARAGAKDQRSTLHVLDLDGKKETKEHPAVHLNRFHWMGADKVYVRGNETGTDGGENGKWGDWVYDLATDKRTPLKVPTDFVVRAVSPDGKTAVVDEWKMTPTEWHQHAHLWTVGDDKPTPLLELNQDFKNLHPQFSPDGKRLLCKVVHYGSYTSVGNGSFNTADFKFNNLLVIDLTTKKQTVVKEYGEKPEWRVGGYAWSPDGKQIAYVETKSLPQQSGAPRAKDSFRVMVADPDGKNEKEIYKAGGSWLMGFDWR